MESKALTVGFIGIGLMGGSIAKSFRRIFPDTRLIAYAPSERTRTLAMEDGVIDLVVDAVDRRFSDCDYIFLCAPVHHNIGYLPLLKKLMKPTCILTDVGSVKSDIYNAILEEGLDSVFIGGHPMVGSEHFGYEYATDHLIENAYYFITPSDTVGKNAVDTFATMIEDLGSIVITLSPQQHDETTAFISHIPHVIAAELVNLAAFHDGEHGMYRQLAAGGFKDITRIASSNPMIWEHILLANPDNVAGGLEEYIDDLRSLIDMIRAKDSEGINTFFAKARDYRDSIPNNAKGVIRTFFEIYVDIPDEAGALAGVVNLLADAGISLKNIGISHNREDEEGVLRISFYDKESSDKAATLLRKHDYPVFER